jgi:hypothetical protein
MNLDAPAIRPPRPGSAATATPASRPRPRPDIPTITLLTFLTLLTAAPTGCGGPKGEPPTPDTMHAIALGDVAELYRIHSLDSKKPPRRLADLERFEQLNPTGLLAIRDGTVVVRWGATMTDLETEGPATSGDDEVLAWLRQVPDSGGMVLMLNRERKTMTADEFRSAKRAGTSDSTTPEKKKKSR